MFKRRNSLAQSCGGQTVFVTYISSLAFLVFSLTLYSNARWVKLPFVLICMNWSDFSTSLRNSSELTWPRYHSCLVDISLMRTSISPYPPAMFLGDIVKGRYTCRTRTGQGDSLLLCWVHFLDSAITSGRVFQGAFILSCHWSRWLLLIRLCLTMMLARLFCISLKEARTGAAVLLFAYATKPCMLHGATEEHLRSWMLLRVEHLLLSRLIHKHRSASLDPQRRLRAQTHGDSWAVHIDSTLLCHTTTSAHVLNKEAIVSTLRRYS